MPKTPRLKRAGAALAACAVVGAACQKLEERPSAISGCAEPDAGCLPGYVSGKGGNPKQDAGTTADAGSSESTDLTGTVILLNDDLRNGILFDQAATISAEGSLGRFVSAPYNGADPFHLTGVKVSANTWVGIKPAVSGLALQTLLWLDTRLSGPQTIGVIQAETLDGIYNRTTLHTSRASGHGHVIVVFTRNDATHAPIAGLSVQIDGAENYVYDTGNSFSDIPTATGSAGTAIIANIPAQPFQGTKQNLVWNGVASGFQEILVAADTVTYVGFALDL